MKIKQLFSGPSLDAFPATVQGPDRVEPVGDKAEIQKIRIEITSDAGETFSVFVDSVARLDGKLVVLGWTSSPKLKIRAVQGTQRWPLKLDRHAREDVVMALGLEPDLQPGFACDERLPLTDAPVGLEITLPRCDPFETGFLAEKTVLSEREQAFLPVRVADLLSALEREEPGSEGWWKIVHTCPPAKAAPEGYHGFIEGIFASPEGDAVVFGWALHPADAPVWLEDDARNVYPLAAAFRRKRGDIVQAFKQVLWKDIQAAFVAYIPALDRAPTLWLKVLTEKGVVTLSRQGEVAMLPPEPREAAAILFDIETEDRLFHQRARLIDWPVLDRLIARREVETGKLIPQVNDFGHMPDAPRVSVIVPLYRRFDFMEHQFLEFDRDPDMREAVELIYVIDDPDIAAAVLHEADRLYQQFTLPFRVISGMCNRGFSGANNLGAAYANGSRLLFMNSDVIPLQAGWLTRLESGLSDAGVGAVGARLLFPDGGLQHGGMDFAYLERLGIWSNQHPGSGLDPVPEDTGLREVPAVTGACLMLPRHVFDAVGGWNTGYLIGDFEDSDLCLAIRETGLKIMYDGSAVLTHLERQSFTGVGEGAFRIRMTICDAVRHQSRWDRKLPRAGETFLGGVSPE